MILLIDIGIFFAIAFVLNLIWENLHSYLYAHYKGGPITERILIRASFVDAVILTLFGLFGYWFTVPGNSQFLILKSILLITIAVALEKWALKIDRWAYKESMPVIPLLRTGLTPTLQLAVIFVLMSLIWMWL